MLVRIPNHDDSFVSFNFDVVNANIPLLGLDTLNPHALVADNVDNVLRSRRHGWSIPIVRHNQHMYLGGTLRNFLRRVRSSKICILTFGIPHC